MPDTRLRKARASLPAGYQFGDARFSSPFGALDSESRKQLAIWENNRDRASSMIRKNIEHYAIRPQAGLTANVIEGDPYGE